MIIVFGSSGHAMEVAAILISTGFQVDYFVSKGEEQIGLTPTIEIITEEQFFTLAKQSPKEIKAFIGIGSSDIRKKVVDKVKSEIGDISFPNLFHPSVIHLYQDSLKIGEGNILFPGVTISTDVVIGDHNHFNLFSSVSHDCKIGNYNSFSPGVRLAGKVAVGNYNFFGINSSVINNTEINNNNVIGAGATVTQNVEFSGTYVGLPARKIK